VRRSSKSTFSSIPTDRALEQTINWEAKSEGGIIGFTLWKRALLRWLLTRHVSGEYADSFKSLCLTAPNSKLNDELGQSCRTRDKEDVGRIQEYLSMQCQDPFNVAEVQAVLLNITTGKIASAQVEEALRDILEEENTALERFIMERLDEGWSKSFWDIMPWLSVMTFSSMRKGLSNDKSRKVIIDTEVLFHHLLSVSKQRDVDLKTVLKYELAAMPLSLFHDDGTMKKCAKSELAKKLEACCEEVLELPLNIQTTRNTAYIFDGMAMLQALNDSCFKTFNDLAEITVKRLVRKL